jgi:peptidoglycan/xylan/chitin deacetylase (PgdA/CDA1 family)
MRTAAGAVALLALAGCSTVVAQHQAAVTLPKSTPSPTPTPMPTPMPTPTPTRTPDCSRLKCIAITFDDGPSTDTPRLLKMLASYGAHSTFFVLGMNAKDHTDILRRQIRDGDEVGDHTYDHASLTGLSTARIHQEINSTAKIIESAIGRPPLLMRPPYGAYDERVAKAVGLPIILWKDDTLDWLHRDSRRVSQVVLKLASRNAVILLHDIQPTSVDAMKTILPELKQRGFTLVTVSQLYAGRPLKAGKVYGMS